MRTNLVKILIVEKVRFGYGLILVDKKITKDTINIISKGCEYELFSTPILQAEL